MSRDDVRAKIRSTIKRLLAKHGYPPDAQPDATELVLRQMETFADEWSPMAHGRLHRPVAPWPPLLSHHQLHQRSFHPLNAQRMQSSLPSFPALCTAVPAWHPLLAWADASGPFRLRDPDLTSTS